VTFSDNAVQRGVRPAIERLSAANCRAPAAAATEKGKGDIQLAENERTTLRFEKDEG